jgi:hypothetical protein
MREQAPLELQHASGNCNLGEKKKSTQDPGREAASDITISFQVPLYHIL